jgi:hypothetical protein
VLSEAATGHAETHPVSLSRAALDRETIYRSSAEELDEEDD